MISVRYSLFFYDSEPPIKLWVLYNYTEYEEILKIPPKLPAVKKIPQVIKNLTEQEVHLQKDNIVS